MSFKTKLRSFYTLFLILPAFLFAQQSPEVPAPHTDRWPLVVNLAQKQMGNDLRLFTGVEYIRNGQHAQGHPFFRSDQPLDGALWYDGAWYDHVSLQFDLVTGEVVTFDGAGGPGISLLKEKLPRFVLEDRPFLRVPIAGDSDRSITSGYYELLADGACTLLARHEKRLVFPSSKEDSVKYVATDGYFIRLSGRYIRIEGKRSLLNALADKKDALKKMIRQHDLNFNKDLENALIQSINYYTQLKN